MRPLSVQKIFFTWSTCNAHVILLLMINPKQVVLLTTLIKLFPKHIGGAGPMKPDLLRIITSDFTGWIQSLFVVLQSRSCSRMLFNCEQTWSKFFPTQYNVCIICIHERVSRCNSIREVIDVDSIKPWTQEGSLGNTIFHFIQVTLSDLALTILNLDANIVLGFETLSLHGNIHSPRWTQSGKEAEW